MSVRRRVPRKREEDPGGVGLSYVAPPPAPIRVNVAFFGHSYVNHMRTYVYLIHHSLAETPARFAT